ncbi:MAG: hypothetical protein ABIB12_03225 [Patescibacteria group bacterium]
MQGVDLNVLYLPVTSFMHPKVRFYVSCKKDVEAFFCFLRDTRYDKGRAFREAVLLKHPSLRQYVSLERHSANKTAIEGYVRNFYARNRFSINSNLGVYKKNWFEIQDQFYALADEIFPSRYWPKGKYIAYPTMWGLYPRYLEDKTFQVPFAHPRTKYVNVVIAHEMLHFIFYQYFFAKWPKYKENEYSFFVWNVSEIFNTVVQNSPRWFKVFELPSLGYPEHEKIVKILQEKYCGTSNLDVIMLIQEIIAAVPRGQDVKYA